MKKILVGIGGTKVKIDRVRHIGNKSHGTFGSMIVRQLFANDIAVLGEDVSVSTLVARDGRKPFSLDCDLQKVPFERVQRSLVNLDALRRSVAFHYAQWEYEFFEDYQSLLYDYLCPQSNGHLGGEPDIVVLTTAASDYLVANVVDGKIRSDEELKIDLVHAEKLIGEVKKWCPNIKLVGFKLLVDSTDEQLIAAAKHSVEKNGCDLVVANDLRDIEAKQHRLLLVTKDDVREFKNTDEYVEGALGQNEYLARVVAREVLGL